MFKLIISLLKCTGCNNIYVFCTEYVEKFFVNIGFLCKGRIYLYSKVIILVLTVFFFFLTSFSISNVIEQGDYLIQLVRSVPSCIPLCNAAINFCHNNPPRTPRDLHQKFAPTLGLLHSSFCLGGGGGGGICWSRYRGAGICQ